MTIEAPTVFLDIETSLTIAQAKSTHGADWISAMAQHPWLAVTLEDNGMLTTWTQTDANAIVAYLQGKTVAGFNIKRFDLPILVATAGEMLENIVVLDLFDAIFQETKVYYSLQDLVFLNLGQRKRQDSANVPALFREGRLGEVVDHAIHDVALELDLTVMAATDGITLPALQSSQHHPHGVPSTRFKLK